MNPIQMKATSNFEIELRLLYIVNKLNYELIIYFI